MNMSRDEILLEMGIRPLWRLRSSGNPPENAGVTSAGLSVVPPVPAMPAMTEAVVGPVTTSVTPASVSSPPPITATNTAENRANMATDLLPADMPPDDRFLPSEYDSMWDTDWEPAGPEACALPAEVPLDPQRLPRHERIAALDWDGLEQAVAECRACGLCKQRQQAVLGVGDRQPQWLFIGEGPGQEEDLRGEPFVGQAGKLLDAMLAALDLRRGDKVYIANAVKCRPPNNRTPTAEEMAFCRPFLLRQIALLQPEIMVLLGKVAVQSLLDEQGPLGSLRGRAFRIAGIPVAVTYHPAYLLRNLPDKAKAWEDLLFARRLLRQAAAHRIAPA